MRLVSAARAAAVPLARSGTTRRMAGRIMPPVTTRFSARAAPAAASRSLAPIRRPSTRPGTRSTLSARTASSRFPVAASTSATARPIASKISRSCSGYAAQPAASCLGQRQRFEKDGKLYCDEHYWQRFGKRCAIGAEFLKGEYVVNSWGDTYCNDHARGLSACYSCHRLICDPLTGGGVRYGDGRSICNRCRRTAIDTVAQGQPVLFQVRRSLAKLGLEIGGVETPLRLLNQNEMKKRSTKAYSKQPAGMASHHTVTRDGQVVERSVEAILILQGLPQEHFAAIAAHELCHTYLFMNQFPELEPLIEEGLCELAEYFWLKQQNTPEAAFRLKLMDGNDDPIYGRGFRAARDAYDRRGLSAVLSRVRQSRQVPVTGGFPIVAVP